MQCMRSASQTLTVIIILSVFQLASAARLAGVADGGAAFSERRPAAPSAVEDDSGQLALPRKHARVIIVVIGAGAFSVRPSVGPSERNARKGGGWIEVRGKRKEYQ